MARKQFTKLLNSIQEALEVFIKKAPSRKFIVFVIATHMAYISILDPSLWFTIATIFMGLQGYLDYASSRQAPPPRNQLPPSDGSV